MTGPRDVRDYTSGEDARQRLLAGAPGTERRLERSGVSTAVPGGSGGPPIGAAVRRGRMPASKRYRPSRDDNIDEIE